jgi:hypothetical protein
VGADEGVGVDWGHHVLLARDVHVAGTSKGHGVAEAASAASYVTGDVLRGQADTRIDCSAAMLNTLPVV